MTPSPASAKRFRRRGRRTPRRRRRGRTSVLSKGMIVQEAKGPVNPGLRSTPAPRRRLQGLGEGARQLLDLVGLRDDPEHALVEKLLSGDVEPVSGAQNRLDVGVGSLERPEAF